MPTEPTGPYLPVDPAEPEGRTALPIPDVAGVGNTPSILDPGYVTPADGLVPGGYLAAGPPTSRVDFDGSKVPGFVNDPPFTTSRFVVMVPAPPQEKDWEKLEDRRRELQRSAADVVRLLDEPTPRVGTVYADAYASDVHGGLTMLLEEYVRLTTDRDAILEERAREKERRAAVLARVAGEQAVERERARIDANKQADER